MLANSFSLNYSSLSFFFFLLLENEPMKVIASLYTSQTRNIILNFDGERAVPLSRADYVSLLLL